MYFHNGKIHIFTLFDEEPKKYNEIIEKTQKGNQDITAYLDWFLGCFERALLASEQNLELILDKAHFWEKHKSIQVNKRQRFVINYFESPTYFA